MPVRIRWLALRPGPSCPGLRRCKSLVIRLLLDGRKTGRELRRQLDSWGAGMSKPAFSQMNAPPAIRPAGPQRQRLRRLGPGTALLRLPGQGDGPLAPAGRLRLVHDPEARSQWAPDEARELTFVPQDTAQHLRAEPLAGRTMRCRRIADQPLDDVVLGLGQRRPQTGRFRRLLPLEAADAPWWTQGLQHGVFPSLSRETCRAATNRAASAGGSVLSHRRSPAVYSRERSIPP